MRETAGALQINAPAIDREITGWSVDSRTLAGGDLFFALRGPVHDGHTWLGDVFAKGASAAVVDHIPANASPEWTLLVVKDTQEALEQLGAWARQRWGKDLIAVTGSAGKTTTKDIIATFLSVAMPVGKTAGNLNNHIGLPLTLLRLAEETSAAVVELGMNHAGEIAALARIAKPRVGVVTNAGAAHVENFDSIEGVAAAKRELIEALPVEGVAVLNADDERVAKFAASFQGRTITYGLSEKADVRAEAVNYSSDGVRFRTGGVTLESKLAGRHGVSNLLAGVAVCSIYGIDPGRLKEAARAIEPGPMRGRRFEKDGILHFNDCYNSNPDAARAMVDLLAVTAATRRLAVLGEMLELGRWSEPLHRDLGIYVARSGLNVLIGIRGAAKHAVEAALEAGIPADAAYFFEEPEEAGRMLRKLARAGDAILWKGSRGTRVELALESFLNSN
ncbi:MAG TPA: UDP-N-acetylmuramoyl-tripeptide--D-alanyl-D-alanine ligase [Bryobacteraceae bacterium]|nr:UDP-N-acetylmuramoyl-tripeptide--D-alanyl-D-alanine ligase [Bryobacteraceae bacterium]